MSTAQFFGKYPFPPEQKRPVHIHGDLIQHFIYPPHTVKGSDLNTLYCSTDKLTVCIFQLGPGGVFDPPDYHAGDEVYYILEGVLTEANPPLGQVVQVKQGEGLLLPKPVWHKGYNYEQGIVRILAVLAPKIWDEGLPPTEFRPEMFKRYKGPHNAGLPSYPALPAPCTLGTADDIGRWPLPGPQSRQEPLLMYPIREEGKLLNVYGTESPMLVKFVVSNDWVHVGEFVLPAGGIEPRYSEIGAHRGDCLLYVEQGPITLYLPDTQEVYQVQVGEAMFIPEGVGYQMINYTAGLVKAIFAIAPGL
jgi:mannose-6-phosphate isomerase-like protein (cupin superfamily)